MFWFIAEKAVIKADDLVIYSNFYIVKYKTPN